MGKISILFRDSGYFILFMLNMMSEMIAYCLPDVCVADCLILHFMHSFRNISK